MKKKCSKCGRLLRLENFSYRREGALKKSSQCKDCQSERGRRARAANLELFRARARAQLAKNRSRYRGMVERYRATFRGREQLWHAGAVKRGLAWKLPVGYLKKLPLICFYSGVELTTEKRLPNTISLDRLDSSKGYTKKNVVFCTATINKMKWSLNSEDFIEICKRISKRHRRPP